MLGYHMGKGLARKCQAIRKVGDRVGGGSEYRNKLWGSRLPKRRHIKFRRRGITKRKHTTFRTRRKFEIKKSENVLLFENDYGQDIWQRNRHYVLSNLLQQIKFNLRTYFFIYLFISSLYMFRASQCSSSGDRIVLIHHLVWIVCVSGCLVCQSYKAVTYTD